MDATLTGALTTYLETFKDQYLTILVWAVPLGAAFLVIKLGLNWGIGFFHRIANGR